MHFFTIAECVYAYVRVCVRGVFVCMHAARFMAINTGRKKQEKESACDWREKVERAMNESKKHLLLSSHKSYYIMGKCVCVERAYRLTFVQMFPLAFIDVVCN